jgi:hypothetical protein
MLKIEEYCQTATNSIVGPLIVCAEKGSMANHRSFGRRGDHQHQPSRSMGVIEAVAQRTRVESTASSVERPVLLSGKPEFSLLDDDSRDYRVTRKQNFQMLWRPLSLMATLCFGIASFVLPDSVNDTVQWLLYALAAASLYAGIRNRRRQAKT